EAVCGHACAPGRGWTDDECSRDPSCALRSMAEVGLSARTHRKWRVLLERWRAQCGGTDSTIQETTPMMLLPSGRSAATRDRTRHIPDVAAAGAAPVALLR